LKKQTAVQFAVLCGVPFVMVLGNSMLIPVFPQMKEVMRLTQFQVGLIVTFFSVPAGILIPLAGFLSDQYGRKTIMVPALFVYGIGGLVLWLRSPISEEPIPCSSRRTGNSRDGCWRYLPIGHGPYWGYFPKQGKNESIGFTRGFERPWKSSKPHTRFAHCLG